MAFEMYVCVSADEVAYDAASPGVRLAAVQGLTGLIDNPLAQPLLKVVLPKLGPLLHDRALKVRVGLADLLLTVMYACSLFARLHGRKTSYTCEVQCAKLVAAPTWYNCCVAAKSASTSCGIVDIAELLICGLV